MLSKLLIAIIAALHVYILALEMFFWTSPRAMKAFNTSMDFAQSTKVMAANQGLYNGFLAAGLIWSLWLGVPGAGRDVALFFLGCVAVAGVFGAMTAARKIIFVQTVPAVLAIAAVLWGV
jgi:putative membrane protein